MAKRIYQVGEPCDTCQTPTIMGKGGTGYCKPCYIAWKNSSEALKPAVRGYNPASVQSATQPSFAPPASKSEATELLTEIRDLLKSIDKKILLRDPETGEIIPF